ncbi:MAG TPA: hypothetical protein VF981_03545 [Gemmatimonadaceae bacterium]
MRRSLGGAQSLAARGALLVLMLACSGDPFTPPGSPGPLGTHGGGTASSGLAGTWRRQLVFIDEFGYVHSSETTWTFATSGDAFRTIVTTNFTLGAADTTFTLARWRLDGTRVIIDFVSPSPGTITLDVRIEGTTLFLAGQAYERSG